jgi:hypothetical protein
MSRREEEPINETSDDNDLDGGSPGPAPARGFNPRLLPPLVGLGLLLVIIAVLFFSRGNQPRPERIEGRVVEKVEQSAEFTYLQLADDAGAPLWLGTPRVEVQPGERVHFESAREMRDFPVTSLKRVFDRILLVDKLFKVDSQGNAVALEQSGSHGRDLMGQAHGHGGAGAHGGMQGHGTGGHGAAGADLDVPKLAKPEDGQSLAEISAEPNKFAGQSIKLRGTIVSARLRVRAAFGQPPTNWYRLSDGSAGAGGKDGATSERAAKAEPLLFTTDDLLKRGDIVVIAGKLTLDKDFGGGLRYKMIVEEPRVTLEKSADAKSKAASKVLGPEPAEPKEKLP